MGYSKPTSSLTMTSPASEKVTEAAIRLFIRGFLAELRFVSKEDGHLYFSIPSESQEGVLYGIDLHPASKVIRCSCPADRHGRFCKHCRLMQLAHNWIPEPDQHESKGKAT